MKKLIYYTPAVCVLLIAASMYFSHNLCETMSIICMCSMIILLGIFCYTLDKDERRA